MTDIEKLTEIAEALAARVEALEKRPPSVIGIGDEMVAALSPKPAASGGPKREPDARQTSNYPLFEYMSRAHGLTLLDSEMDEIVRVVRKMMQPATPERHGTALLVDQWRAQADQLIRDFPGCPKPAERAETIRHCADQLAALLPPEKESKS